jgi:SPP1 gp7 family putative phage head morphogenesis protein
MAKKQEQKLVINQLVVKAPNRRPHDVGEWRNALRAADMGRVKLLYDLFEDLLIDGVLADAVEKRVMAVTNSPLTFQDASGKEVPAILDLIDTPDFETMLATIMDSKLYGRSGGEFDFTDGFRFHQIPAKHIRPESKVITINDYDEHGIPYTDDDMLLVLGQPRKFGLLLKAAPYAIWKRGGFGDYAQWLEIFGMPQRVGKYSSYDPESRKLLEEALEKAGSAPYVVIPKESEVETTNNTGSGSSGNSYNDFRKACNEEILITLLGQTLTTTQNDTGARSLGEVHKDVEEGKNRADMRFVQRVLNYQVLPILEKRGFPVAGGKFVFPESAEQLTVSDVIQLSDIIEIPATFLHDKYSIPVPKDGETIARRVVRSLSGAEAPDEQDEDEPDKKPVKKTASEDDNKDVKMNDAGEASESFWKGLFSFFVPAPARRLTDGALNGKTLTLNDESFQDRIIKYAVGGFGSAQPPGKAPFMPELFEYISADLLKALDAKPVQNADLGFEYNYQDDAFRTAQELNVFHFSAAKTLAELQQLNELYRQSSSADDFRKKAGEMVETFNERWQKTEWETASLVSASTSNYNRLAGKTKLFPIWEYRTVGDDKVRQEHRDINGIKLPANDERWNKIWPPNGWKCRCYVVPRMANEATEAEIAESRARVDAYMETPEFAAAKAQGFGVNRALVPEVFAENQMYIKKFPNQASKLLKDVNYHTFGLKNYEANKAAASGNMPLFEGTKEQFMEQLRKENDTPLATDYNDRSIRLDAKAKGDASSLQAALETLKTPDEVWINGAGGKGFGQFVMLKYYKDKVMAVVAGIEKGIVYRVASFGPAAEKGEKYLYRSGLLIKRTT